MRNMTITRTRRTSAKRPKSPQVSPLQAELAARILRSLHEQGAGSGHHLVEQDLCRQFGVSRTPIRGALKVLADQGCVEARANRGFVLLKPVTNVPDIDPVDPQGEDDKRLFVVLTRGRNFGRLPVE